MKTKQTVALVVSYDDLRFGSFRAINYGNVVGIYHDDDPRAAVAAPETMDDAAAWMRKATVDVMTPERVALVTEIYNADEEALTGLSGEARAKALPLPYRAEALALLHLGRM